MELEYFQDLGRKLVSDSIFNYSLKAIARKSVAIWHRAFKVHLGGTVDSGQ